MTIWCGYSMLWVSHGTKAYSPTVQAGPCLSVSMKALMGNWRTWSAFYLSCAGNTNLGAVSSSCCRGYDMALKDPPTYVGLDPALIYGVHDLKRETYQRLLQLIGWMWVTRKSRNPLGTSVEELAERWDIAERTVYHTLQTLAEKDYIGVTYTDSKVHIIKGPRCQDNRPREAVHTQQVAGGDTQHARGAGNHNRPREAASQQDTDLVQAGCTVQAGCANSSVVVVGSTSDDQTESLQLQQTSNSAVQDLMERAGIFGDRAASLASDPWVTEDRVNAWCMQLAGDKTIRSLPAVLYSNLKAHREPPSPKGDDDYWRNFVEQQTRRRYIEGEWADIIEH